MADDKKRDAKAPPKPEGSFFSHPDPFIQIVWTFLALLIIAYLISAFLTMIVDVINGRYLENDVFRKIRNIAIGVWLFLVNVRYLLVILSAIIFFWVMYLFKKIQKLRIIEHKLLYPETSVVQENKNPHWERILNHSESLNENDWRLAIIEADIMLDGLLDKLNLQGESIGEKLKAVEKSDFTTIDNAWEAHKVRNQIAHEGVSFLLNQREAKRVIALYDSVFTEFKII